MTLQEKFDTIVDSIEYYVSTGEQDIPQALAAETGFNLRLLGDAFQFITDITLIKYIRQRRLIHALTTKLRKNLSVEDIAADTLFCDAAAFTKACKSEFGFTPGQVTEDVLAKHPPLFFSRVISGNNVDQLEKDNLNIPNNDTIQSVSSEQFAEIKRALEISAIYGFSDDEAESVYHFATKCNLTVEEAAEFYEEAKLQDKYDLTSHEAAQILYEIRCNGFAHLYELPEGFFDVYFSEENSRHGWFVPYIYEIAEALNRNSMCADDLDQIVSHADTFGVDIVEAIDRFDEFEKTWDDMISDAWSSSILDDNTDGFGYLNIWELDED